MRLFMMRKNDSAALETNSTALNCFLISIFSVLYGLPISQFELPSCPTSFRLGSLTSKTYSLGVDLQLLIED